ncbi:MAG: PD-(D/E)XK nuclease family protein [Candidatus Micrarchaeia archaeon]
MEKNSNVMEKLHKSVIRATDIAAQFWCEKQMELGYMYGRKESPEMRSGSEAHKEIETIVNIPLKLKPESYADSFYKNLYAGYLAFSTLKERGIAREISIYGSINGFKIAGKLDEIRLEEGKIAVYEDKTKGSDKEPTAAQISSHAVQVQLYVKMLKDIKSGAYSLENFARSYYIENLKVTPNFTKQLEDAKISMRYYTIMEAAKMYFGEILKAPEISDIAHLRYTFTPTGKVIKISDVKYEEQEFSKKIGYAFEYWRGEREAKPVEESEKWKCNYCQFFGKQCKVWYTEKQKVL